MARTFHERDIAGNLQRLPAINAYVRQLIEEVSGKTTLLAVCPNSEAVLRAALRAAKEANAPMLFAATLNQVDLDGGYTGWTPSVFCRFAREEAARIDLNTPVLVCLDHGGPWLKDAHTTERLTFEQTMEAVKRSIEACLDAGYALLHIDPTVDRTIPEGRPMPIQLVVDRTLELIAHAEAYRRQMNLPPVGYEVGTEEVHGGLADIQVFKDFLALLDAGLSRLGLEEARPCFVVGKVGTDLHTTTFDPEMARTLTRIVRPYGALLKGHYSDNVQNPEAYPLAGMGGANVGPEYTEEEFQALMDLCDLERALGLDSGLQEALKEAVLQSGRWTKWLTDDEKSKPFDDLAQERRHWLISTCSRYIWTAEPVVEARNRLYHNLNAYRDADAYVVWRIQCSIMKYYHAFNLINFCDRFEDQINNVSPPPF